ncbi:MAG: DUF748 domain-containing protein, partial [Syntrophaceae bacterium]|nr:DUF748 domain-containing protein [Syntrophaceae bacterium]
MHRWRRPSSFKAHAWLRCFSVPVFNPSSGKFAGYHIAKGKLFSDLHYKIENRKLEAQHKIRIDQLEGG